VFLRSSTLLALLVTASHSFCAVALSYKDVYLLFLEAVRPRFMRSDLSILAIYRVYSYGSWFDNMANIPRSQRDIPLYSSEGRHQRATWRR